MLVDVLDVLVAGSTRADIIKRVSTLYADAFAVANAHRPSPNHTFSVQFVTTKPSPADTDLVLYFLPSTFYSIITFAKTGAKKSNLLHDHWGFTDVTVNAANAATAGSAKSEIICKSNDPNILGSLVVHEILHNKTFKDNKVLHATGGIGAATVEGDTKMNAANNSDIATTITKKVTQWADGFDLMVAAKRARDSGDPFWDQF